MEDDDVYGMIDLHERQVYRLRRVQWSPITNLKWCESQAGNCFCNRETGKLFECVKVQNILTNFVGQASEVYSQYENESTFGEEVQPEGAVGVFTPSDEDVEFENVTIPDDDGTHRKRDMDEERRNRRRGRKHRRNRKRNRNEDEDNSEYFGAPLAEEDYPEANMLPKQEAINSNPMVTAMRPPNRRYHHFGTTESTNFEPHSPNERHLQEPNPRMQESVHSDYQHQHNFESVDPSSEPNPELEVPVQRKTVAGRVSEDLEQITEDVQQIRSDVVFNQRILLVTVAVAGVAMLG